ncbi:MAG: response regulator transcription factor [Solirubrobacterales bacterium]
MNLPRSEPLATIVVCEDDAPTLELLCDHLTADRYEALAAPSASDALRLCRFRAPDLLLLDLGLPDAPGLEVLREIRRTDGATGHYDPGLPVIAVTGSSSEPDRLRGFGAGADDFVAKPFSYVELAARIKAVLRRRHEAPRSGPVHVGELCVDPSRREARVGDRVVPLANKEFELLRKLASEPERVFTKEDLLREVWGFRSMGRTRTLDSHASRLRRKLDPDHGRFVQNIWGVGYRLVGG